MVVMPTSLIPNWLDEAAHFTPQLKVLALYGAGRKKHFDRLAEYDLVLTTYALLPKDVERLAAQPLHVLILDEAQYIKNPTSKAAQAARELDRPPAAVPVRHAAGKSPGRIVVAVSLPAAGVAWGRQEFQPRLPCTDRKARQRCTTAAPQWSDKTFPAAQDQGASGDRAAAQDRDHPLGRTQRCPAGRLRNHAPGDGQEGPRRDHPQGVARSQIIILEALLKLRQVCCDLRLINDATLPARGSTSGKLDSLMEMLEELFEEGRRVLLFSQFTSMLALIEEELKKRGVEYAILTGQTRDRRTPVKEFQSGKRQIFLISLKAGGVGLNLTEADTVIHYDPWWNPATENQATDRAYRIGQEKPVFVYKLIARGTVEEKIQLLQKEKSDLAAGVLDGRVAGDWKLQSDDIEALFAPLPDKLEKR